MGNYLIPFSRITDEPFEYWYNKTHGMKEVNTDKVYWKENPEWNDKVQVLGFSRGRSAVKIEIISLLTNKKYQMFISDFISVVKNTTIVNGVFDGKFTFVKKGCDYAVRLIQ